jgi:predicted nucleic acid-binding Zn ribbon protein
MIYPWLCKTCDQVTDVIRALADIDLPPEACEHCSSKELKRVIIRPDKVKGVILMDTGTGFHDHNYTRYRSIK